MAHRSHATPHPELRGHATQAHGHHGPLALPAWHTSRKAVLYRSASQRDTDLSHAPKPPGLAASLFLVLLGCGAIFAGLDAIVSDSTVTPSKMGSGTRVHGNDTILVGTGWLLIGLGFLNRVVSGHLGVPIERWITLGCCITGGVLWMQVFL